MDINESMNLCDMSPNLNSDGYRISQQVLYARNKGMIEEDSKDDESYVEAITLDDENKKVFANKFKFKC